MRVVRLTHDVDGQLQIQLLKCVETQLRVSDTSSSSILISWFRDQQSFLFIYWMEL